MRKNILFYIITMIILLVTFKISDKSYIANSSTGANIYELIKQNEDNLNTQEIMQLESFYDYLSIGYYDEYADCIMAKAISPNVVKIIVDAGYYTEFVEDFKSIGMLPNDYKAKAISKSENINNNSTPEPVTMEKCEEKVMWSKSDVNVRENGSTSYKKVGSLKKDEKVTVTGIDSTGWYEIRKEDGTVGHVSDKYLTEEAPSVSADVKENEKVPEANPVKESYIINIDGRTVTWYNAELGMEEIAVLDDKIPLDKVEEMANQYLIHGESYSPTPVAEPTEKPTPAPTVAPSKEPESMPTVSPTDVLPEENAAESTGNFIEKLTDNPIYIFSCIAVGIGLIVYGIYHTRKNRKK